MWITLGEFRVPFGVWKWLRSHFGVTSASLLACEGDFGVTLELLFAYDGDFVATLGSFCGHYWHVREALGALWVTLGLFWEHLQHMVVPLGSLWGDFEISLGSVCVSVGDFGSLDDHFPMIVESLWVYAGLFSKNTHCPHKFEWFYIAQGWIVDHFGSLSGHFWVTFGVWRWLWSHCWHVKATLGSLWNYFSYMLVTPWQLWGHFVVTICMWGWLWGHFGWLWGYFGSTCGIGGFFGDDFDLILGSVWG